jgi:sulfate adenylyltransferase
MAPIEPYGGELVDRTVSGGEADRLREQARELPEIALSGRVLSDLYLLAVGGLSPLEGFMSRETYRSVLSEMALPDRLGGLPWTMPIVLPATDAEAGALTAGGRAALRAPDGELAGVVEVAEVYGRDLEREARAVYGTTEEAHPGVAAIGRMGSRYVAGPVHYLYERDLSGFPDHNLTPARVREALAERGWDTAVAFQTRNPIHRAHEYIQKCALELVDGLLVHPLVGETKEGDVPADVRMRCYRVMLENYFPAERTMLSVLPAAMRYAGPKEAVHHAIMRRNYGCTHFIVGRDHAGVGDYYGTYDAQEIFQGLDGEKLGITPMKFEHAFYCKLTDQMATSKTTPSDPEDQVYLSGTKVREMLRGGKRPPETFSRPEVADVLVEAYREEGS